MKFSNYLSELSKKFHSIEVMDAEVRKFISKLKKFYNTGFRMWMVLALERNR